MESPSAYGENGMYELFGKENESVIDLYKLGTMESEQKPPQMDDKFASYIYSMEEEVNRGTTLETMNPKLYQLFQVIQT